MGSRQHWKKSETEGLQNWKQMKESMKQFLVRVKNSGKISERAI